MTSGAGGEVIRWDLAKTGAKGGWDWEFLHKEHNRSCFSISVYGDKVYSVGQDRAVACFNMAQVRR